MLRRDFLKGMAFATATAPLIAPRDILAGTLQSAQTFTATGQPVPTVLWMKRGSDEARLDFSTEEGYRQVAWLLRDKQSGSIGKPHMRLLQLMAWQQAWLAAYGIHIRMNIHSGLRMPWTNQHTENAAKNSYHLPDRDMVFKAADYDTPNVPSNYMGQLARYASQGGVGFYPASGFTHIDTGPIGRVWVGPNQRHHRIR
jgi:uncharacterized protein YcbK (DUF882 family)